MKYALGTPVKLSKVLCYDIDVKCQAAAYEAECILEGSGSDEADGYDLKLVIEDHLMDASIDEET
jgi:hypothetical protein